MKIQIIEKECVAKTGISIEFSNSEQNAIDAVNRKVADSIDKAVEQSTTIVQHSQNEKGNYEVTYENASKVPVLIDLETAMRIHWLLNNFVHKNDSGLFNTADNLCLTKLAEINHEVNELTNKGDLATC